MSSPSVLHSFKDIFAKHRFVVPEYQRGYAWDVSQWNALWQDLVHVGSLSGVPHFTGSLFLRPLDDVGQRMEVVDGQQRLVTCMLLSRLLAVRAQQPQPECRLSFTGNEELQDYFDFHALGRGDLAARLSREPSAYALRLQRAHQHLGERVAQLEPTQAQRLLNVLLSQFRLFVLPVPSGFDVHVAFETLNNRGRKLSQMELLKNRLIYLTTVLPAAQVPGESTLEALRDQIHRAWKGIYKSLGRSERTQDDDDALLDAHATAYFGRKREADWLSNTLLNEEFTPTNANLSPAAIGAYVQSLETAAAWWSHIHDPRDMPSVQRQWLVRLDRSGMGYFKPMLLAACMRLAAQSEQPVVLKPTEHAAVMEPLVPLLREVERFVVVVYRLLGNSANLGGAYMHGCAHWLLRGCVAKPFPYATQVASDVAGAIGISAAYVKAWVDNREEADGTFSDARFSFAGVFSTEKALNVVAQRFRQKNGYYNWDFTKLVLWEYEEAFRLGGSQPQKLQFGWDDLSFSKTVEHIYPQTPTEVLYWQQHMAIDGRNRRLPHAVQNSLGNLLLLARGQNSSVSNHGYDEKRETFKNNSYSATEVAGNFDHWDALSIALRGVVMLKFVERRWGIALTATPDKLPSYGPLLFGEKWEDVASGEAGRKVQLGRYVDVVSKLGVPHIS
jgi:hypothetical protein